MTRGRPRRDNALCRQRRRPQERAPLLPLPLPRPRQPETSSMKIEHNKLNERSCRPRTVRVCVRACVCVCVCLCRWKESEREAEGERERERSDFHPITNHIAATHNSDHFSTSEEKKRRITVDLSVACDCLLPDWTTATGVPVW